MSIDSNLEFILYPYCCYNSNYLISFVFYKKEASHFTLLNIFSYDFYKFIIK